MLAALTHRPEGEHGSEFAVWSLFDADDNFRHVGEVLIFMPLIARFRLEFLMSRLERAQIASLAVEAGGMIDEVLDRELLITVGVHNVVLLSNRTRQLMLSSPIEGPLDAISICAGQMRPCWSSMLPGVWQTPNRA